VGRPEQVSGRESVDMKEFFTARCNELKIRAEKLNIDWKLQTSNIDQDNLVSLFSVLAKAQELSVDSLLHGKSFEEANEDFKNTKKFHEKFHQRLPSPKL
jgi:hypothetical protein